jgi:hypothetical protein
MTIRRPVGAGTLIGMSDFVMFERLALALAAGILIGIERGWHGRAEAEGSRVAGIRTFGLIGLLGGVWMLIADFAGEVVLGLAFGAFALVFLGSHMAAVQQRHDVGATTAVAALLTFALGAMAVAGELALAAAGAVITSMLLGLKPVMHRWLERISYEELLAVLKLLVMSVVLLPVLPNERGVAAGVAEPRLRAVAGTQSVRAVVDDCLDRRPIFFGLRSRPIIRSAARDSRDGAMRRPNFFNRGGDQFCPLCGARTEAKIFVRQRNSVGVDGYVPTRVDRYRNYRPRAFGSIGVAVDRRDLWRTWRGCPTGARGISVDSR